MKGYSAEQLQLIQLEVVKLMPKALQGIAFADMVQLIEEKKLVGILNSAFRTAIAQEKVNVTDTFKYNKLEQKWQLIQNLKESKLLPPDQLEIATPFVDKEKVIFGHELIRRAVEAKCNFSQHQAEYLLEFQELIPQDWRPYCIIFPGTIWADSAKRHTIPYLVYKSTGWALDFYWVDKPFAAASRLLRRKQ